jgi:hypothetical protein
MNTPMTPDEEYAFYAQPENQEPQGPARRRDSTRLSAPASYSADAWEGVADEEVDDPGPAKGRF